MMKTGASIGCGGVYVEKEAPPVQVKGSPASMSAASSSGSGQRWAERIRDGDEGAFEELFETYYARLCPFAAGYVGSLAAGRDVVQKVFIKIWLRRRRWTLHGSLKAYLYRAVRNQALDHMKRERRRAARESIVERERVSRTADDDYQLKELTAVIWEIIDRLPERRRRAFVLYRQHGLSYREIAEVMGTRPRTAENQVARAMKFLQETLPPEYF